MSEYMSKFDLFVDKIFRKPDGTHYIFYNSKILNYFQLIDEGYLEVMVEEGKKSADAWVSAKQAAYIDSYNYACKAIPHPDNILTTSLQMALFAFLVKKAGFAVQHAKLEPPMMIWEKGELVANPSFAVKEDL